MKAVIVDKEGKYAVALTKNGEFIKIKNKGSFKVGYEIDIASGSSFNTGMFTKITAAAASILLVMGIGLGAYSYAMPYSYINIDINPSIEVTTNIYDRIINVKALNEDGDKVLSSVSARNKEVEVAISNILQSAVMNGYIGGESDNAVMFTVSGKSEHKVEEIQTKLEDTAEKQLNNSSEETEIIVEKVTLERHDKAEDMGISPGKVLLIERLQESDPDADMESYKDAPVKEIMKKISADRKADDDSIKASGKLGNESGKDEKESKGKENKNGKSEVKDNGKDKSDVKYNNGKSDASKDTSVASKNNTGKNNNDKNSYSQKYKSNNQGKTDNNGKSNTSKIGKNGKSK